MTSEPAFDDADLNGFVDGRIEPSRAVVLAEFLASDPEARARLDGWKRQNGNLRTMFASVLFEPVPVRLLPAAMPQPGAAVGASPAQHPAVPPRRLSGVVTTTLIGTTLVGFALGGLAGAGTTHFGLWSRISAGPGTMDLQPARSVVDRSLAEVAVDAHHTFLGDAMRPVELSAADEPKLLRWIESRLSASLRIPDLGRQGWTLMGGRIVPGTNGPAAFLVYSDGTARLGLTISRAPDFGTGAIATAGTVDPIGVSTWGDETFGYAITSDLGADWLERHAGSVRDSVRAQVRGAGTSGLPRE